MKNLILTILVAFVATFANAKNDTTVVTFYFPAQSSTLTQAQVDSIQTIIANNNVVAVTGFANQLPNTVTNQANVNLALDRAMSVAMITGTVDVTFEVVMSNSSLDRRVEIMIVTNTMDYTYTNIYGEEVTLGEIVDKMNSSDNSSTNETETNNNQLPINIDVVKVNTINVENTIPNFKSTIKGDIVIEYNAHCGCSPVGNSLRDTWALYKSYQDSAKVYAHQDAGLKDLYTLKARELRKCWRLMHNAYKYQTRLSANNPNFDITKYMIEKEVKEINKKNNLNVKSNRNRKKRKKVRLKRSIRLNDNVWIKIFPFSAC